MSENPNQDSERRHSDGVLIALTQRFNDFIERYDRDCGANGEWRRMVDQSLKEQSQALSEISPAYAKGKWVVGLIAIGSIALAVKAFWSHIAFK
jgi:hypothetical protein